MAFEIILNGLVVDQNNNPTANDAVNLYLVLEQNPITSYRNTTLIQSKPTDKAGRVIFSGVTAGLYDIIINNPSGTVGLYNYEVKNSYVVPEGSSQSVFESRTSVRSSETISGAGVLISNEFRNEQHLGYPTDDYTENWSGIGYVTKEFENRIDGTTFNETVYTAREFNDSYYVNNQNLPLVQNFKIKVLV